MANKKLIAGGIIAALIIATITVIGIVPLVMYGSGETETQVKLGMTTDGSASTSLSTSSIETSQDPTVPWSPSTTDPEVNTIKKNAYETFFNELIGGESQTSVENQEGSAASGIIDATVNLSIYITFNLTTPSNQSLTFEFNPQNLDAQSLDVVLRLDEEDLNGETGEFHLEITITISLYVEVANVGVVLDKEWSPAEGPITKDFTV